MNWFDGWAINQYKDDLDKWEYNKAELDRKSGGAGDFKRTQVKEDTLKEMQS